MVFNADSAVMDNLVSERVCLLLKKRCSTKMLTLGIARSNAQEYRKLAHVGDRCDRQSAANFSVAAAIAVATLAAIMV
jgi:hypothetical protein